MSKAKLESNRKLCSTGIKDEHIFVCSVHTFNHHFYLGNAQTNKQARSVASEEKIQACNARNIEELLRVKKTR